MIRITILFAVLAVFAACDNNTSANDANATSMDAGSVD